MTKHLIRVVALSCLVAAGACMKDKAKTEDTATVPGTDTVNVPTAVPTTDTVVKTTTTTTDTVKGKVNEDSAKAAAAKKKKP